MRCFSGVRVEKGKHQSSRIGKKKNTRKEKKTPEEKKSPPMGATFQPKRSEKKTEVLEKQEKLKGQTSAIGMRKKRAHMGRAGVMADGWGPEIAIDVKSQLHRRAGEKPL